MDMDPSSLSLFIATEEQAKESLRRAYDYWGKDMTLEEYEVRDQTWIREFESAKKGNFTSWVLAPREDPRTLDFKCSCKTLKWPAIIARRGKVLAALDTAKCYAVGSVFTPSRHRGHGYAAHMMRLLHWVLAPESFLRNFEFPREWGSRPEERRGDGSFSILYSDIGSEFYLKCGLSADSGITTSKSNALGWLVREPISTSWDAGLLGKLDPHGPGLSDVTWEWLDENGVKECCDVDEESIRADLAEFATSQVETDRDVTFAVLPGHGVEAFQRGRLRHALRDYHIDRWGVLIKDTSSLSMASWIVEFPRPPVTTPRKLLISHLRVGNPAHLPLILKLASDVSRSVDVTMVEVWNVPQHVKDSAARCGGVEKERETGLSSFKWYGDDDPGRVNWMFNERYCRF